MWRNELLSLLDYFFSCLLVLDAFACCFCFSAITHRLHHCLLWNWTHLHLPLVADHLKHWVDDDPMVPQFQTFALQQKVRLNKLLWKLHQMVKWKLYFGAYIDADFEDPQNLHNLSENCAHLH